MASFQLSTPTCKPEFKVEDELAKPTRSLSQRPGSIYERERVKNLHPALKEKRNALRREKQREIDSKNRVKKQVPDFDSLPQAEQDRLYQAELIKSRERA